MRNLAHELSLFAFSVDLLLVYDHRRDPYTIIEGGRGVAETESSEESPLHNWTLSLHQRSSCVALVSWNAHPGSFESSTDVLYFDSSLSQLFTMVAYGGEIVVFHINCFSRPRSLLDSGSGMSSGRPDGAVLVLSCSPIPNTE